MSAAHLRLMAPAWLRLGHRTARFRLTVLYGGLFLLSGAALVTLTNLLFEHAARSRTVHIPTIPNAPALGELDRQIPLLKAQAQAEQLQVPLGSKNTGTTLQDELARVQHQLALAQHQLAQAAHQVAQAGSVQAAQRAADSHQLLVNSGIALAVLAAIALLSCWLIAGRTLRPIRTITRTAQRISAANLHERLALEGPDDELKQLGDTLDDLFVRLEAAFESQRHFVANASHELRTPLTRERTLVQVALGDPSTSEAWRSTGEELLASNRQQEALIDALLTLASSERGLENRQPVDLAATVGAALVPLEPVITRLGIHVDISISPAPIDGDAVLIERLVANLLTNALRHNSVGGKVEVMTKSKERSSVLSIRNTGPYVPPDDVERLFEPFQRLNARRENDKHGHGLGLTIVRAIATAHGASVTASSMANGGLSVRVAFACPANTRAAPKPRAWRAHTS